MARSRNAILPPSASTDIILLSEGNVPDLLALIDQRLEKSSHWVGEVQARRKDGSEFLAKVERSLVRDDDQTILGSVEVARDLTEKKQMEAELLHAERLRALGVTASGVAHQINNVLGSVVGQADLLRLQLSDRASQEQLETIIRAAQDGVEAVRRIQRFSRETPQEPFEPVELEALVRDVVRTTAPRWRDESRREGRPIHLVAESDGPVWTEGLPAELRELLMNLVFNAVDALPVGGTIKIRLEASGDVARLRVKDTGIGMTEDVAAKVFEPFFTTKPGGRGTGLGLALAYATVQRHGGRIQVKSRPGQGTEFEILLRQRDVAGPQVPISLTSGMAPQRLLVVDDDIAQANRLAAVLRHDGHQVEVCGSGEQGIAALESRPFDLVLTALVMPVVSGWDVTREAKRRIPHVRVGLLAGWSEDIDPARLAVAGVDFVLSKPYRTEQVRAAIAKAMRAPDANKIVA